MHNTNVDWQNRIHSCYPPSGVGSRKIRPLKLRAGEINANPTTEDAENAALSAWTRRDETKEGLDQISNELIDARMELEEWSAWCGEHVEPERTQQEEQQQAPTTPAVIQSAIPSEFFLFLLARAGLQNLKPLPMKGTKTPVIPIAHFCSSPFIPTNELSWYSCAKLFHTKILGIHHGKDADSLGMGFSASGPTSTGVSDASTLPAQRPGTNPPGIPELSSSPWTRRWRKE